MNSKQHYCTEVELEEFIWKHSKGDKAHKTSRKELWVTDVVKPSLFLTTDTSSIVKQANQWLSHYKYNFSIDDVIIEEPETEFDSPSLIWSVRVYES